ncbi:MAG: MBL fold metallo-hydrolase, partial [Acetobacteraceae bacterium]|nr:MBL fold metallo-hydrolase [Acetobacteraceae bacterium]
YPGASLHNGTLGWSSVALARGPEGRIALLDTGAFGLRRVLLERLRAAGVAPEQVTDLLLSHLHYDHCDNWTLFPRAAVHVRAAELEWALRLPETDPLVPVPVVRALAGSGRVMPFDAGAAPAPGIAAVETPGHSPHHVAFLVEADPKPVIFAADGAKNLAELLAGEAEMTMDATQSRESIRRLRALWEERPEALLIPGHDLPLARRPDGRPERIGRREAGILAVLGEDTAERRRFALGG